MADISDINSAQAVKIIGADSSGVEQTPVKSSSNGKLETSQISNNSGVEGALTVGTSAVELKVGASALSNRINATLINNSNTDIYWGYTNAVTTTTGTPIVKGQFACWSVGPNTSIFLIAGSAGNNTRITESA
jgi:hypothetical protein